MPKKGNTTRERILETAEALVLRQGYTATSVDRLIEAAGITKGTFFYHFPTKHTLAEALVRRWAERDIGHLEANLQRAEKLAREPLQQLLIFVGLFEEMFDQPAMEPPGCLYASFCYEAELMDADIALIVRDAFDRWRERLRPWLEAAAERNPPRMRIDAGELADMLGVIFEGAFIMSRIYADARVIPVQLRHYRNYLELLFS